MLTDEQKRAAINALYDATGETLRQVSDEGVEAIFRAGIAWGAADMRERAATKFPAIGHALRALPLPGEAP